MVCCVNLVNLTNSLIFNLVTFFTSYIQISIAWLPNRQCLIQIYFHSNIYNQKIFHIFSYKFWWKEQNTYTTNGFLKSEQSKFIRSFICYGRSHGQRLPHLAFPIGADSALHHLYTVGRHRQNEWGQNLPALRGTAWPWITRWTGESQILLAVAYYFC